MHHTEPLEVVVGKLLVARHHTLAIAESCTGGLLTHRLTNVPGSSAYIIASVIAYAYEAKVIALGVSWDTLNRFGAVSAETATEMARGARERFSATLGLAITGIAGPGGGTPEKPVGLVYLALDDARQTMVERHVWSGNRVQNKEQSAQAALELLYRYLTDDEGRKTKDE
ncbi:MAG: CinA family protein [Anaerolineae bacterium]|nr:CinA family protein [Anaerolineae bacterium]